MQKTVLTFLAAFILSFIISVLSLVSANSPVVLDFAEYHNGTVNKQDTATVENTELDGSGGTDDRTMYNVTYRNNLITECVYSIEYFFNEITGVLRDGNNILFEGNIMRRCGYGFGSTRPNGNGQRHIRSNPYGNPFRNFVIRDNILDRSVCDLLRIQFSKDIYRPQISGNTYVVGVGNSLCTYGYGNGISYTADVSSVPTIKAVLGDIRAKVYFTDYVPYYSYNYTSYN